MKGVSQSWLRGRDRCQIPSGHFVGPVVCVEAVQILTVVGFMQPPNLLALHAINFAVADYACFWAIYYVNIPCQVSEGLGCQLWAGQQEYANILRKKC